MTASKRSSGNSFQICCSIISLELAAVGIFSRFLSLRDFLAGGNLIASTIFKLLDFPLLIIRLQQPSSTEALSRSRKHHLHERQPVISFMLIQVPWLSKYEISSMLGQTSNAISKPFLRSINCINGSTYRYPVNSQGSNNGCIWSLNHPPDCLNCSTLLVRFGQEAAPCSSNPPTI